MFWEEKRGQQQLAARPGGWKKSQMNEGEKRKSGFRGGSNEHLTEHDGFFWRSCGEAVLATELLFAMVKREG